MRTKILLGALAAVLISGTSRPLHAEDYQVEGLLGILATGKGMELDKGHFAWMGEDHATFFSAKGEGGLFDKVSNKCTDVGDIDTNNKKVKFGGYCVQGNDEENQAWFWWSCETDAPGHPCSGTDDYIGGTGKYRGITGKVNFVGHAIRDWKDGMYTNWSAWTGQVTIPH